ncbi:hypothetical protein ACI2LF_06925 [Kribbella sp. NPDC020789]
MRAAMPDCWLRYGVGGSPWALIANTIGSADPDAVLRALRAYIPAFFDQHLRHRPQHGIWRRALPGTAFID